MQPEPSSTPDVVVASGDPGDETARRYRYQWTWAAISCCMLLDDSTDTFEVFCEHHEDVLLKRKGGRFCGLQIKTRADSLDPWKTGDDAVKNALARFCRLEHAFPGQFEAFRFLTNHSLHVAGNGQDICHVLAQIRDSGTLETMPLAVRRHLASIAKLAECEESGLLPVS